MRKGLDSLHDDDRPVSWRPRVGRTPAVRSAHLPQPRHLPSANRSQIITLSLLLPVAFCTSAHRIFYCGSHRGRLLLHLPSALVQLVVHLEPMLCTTQLHALI